MYTKIKNIEKFTPKEEVDSIIGPPRWQLENRLVYYYGNGFIIAYSSMCFRVEGCERIEYGEEGVYAVSVYHFCDVQMLKEYFNLEHFEEDDKNCMLCDAIVGAVDYAKSFSEIHSMELHKQNINHYREGETRVMENGKMKIQNLFIMCDAFTFLFRGNSKKGKLSGFRYTLQE